MCLETRHREAHGQDVKVYIVLFRLVSLFCFFSSLISFHNQQSGPVSFVSFSFLLYFLSLDEAGPSKRKSHFLNYLIIFLKIFVSNVLSLSFSYSHPQIFNMYFSSIAVVALATAAHGMFD